LNEGSSFHAILPSRDREHAPAARTTSSANQTILVVEPTESTRVLTVRALTAAGYTVETATNAAEATSLCCAQTYAGLTVNLLLPQGSLLSLLRAIRSEGENRHTPVVLLAVVAEPGETAAT